MNKRMDQSLFGKKKLNKLNPNKHGAYFNVIVLVIKGLVTKPIIICKFCIRGSW